MQSVTSQNSGLEKIVETADGNSFISMIKFSQSGSHL